MRQTTNLTRSPSTESPGANPKKQQKGIPSQNLETDSPEPSLTAAPKETLDPPKHPHSSRSAGEDPSHGPHRGEPSAISFTLRPRAMPMAKLRALTAATSWHFRTGQRALGFDSPNGKRKRRKKRALWPPPLVVGSLEQTGKGGGTKAKGAPIREPPPQKKKVQ